MCIRDRILDVYGLTIDNPAEMEQRINNIVGVVCNGIFAAQKADKLLIAGADGVKTLTANLPVSG